MAAGSKAELNTAINCASTGSGVGPVGQWTEKCVSLDGGLQPTVERLLGVRKNPNVLLRRNGKVLWESVSPASLAVLEARFAWQTLAGLEEHPSLYTDERRGVARSEFLRLAAPARDRCSGVVKALNEVED